MPHPLFAVGAAISQGIRVVGKSPIFKSALAGAKSAAGAALSGQNTTLTTSGVTTNINAQGQAMTTSNNLLLIVGVALGAIFLLKK